jgi:hypothetical protein
VTKRGCWSQGNFNFDVFIGNIGGIGYPKTPGIHIKITHQILLESAGIKAVDRDLIIPVLGKTAHKKEHDKKNRYYPQGILHWCQVKCFVFIFS